MAKHIFVIEIEADSQEAAQSIFDTGTFSVPVGVDVTVGYLGESTGQ